VIARGDGLFLCQAGAAIRAGALKIRPIDLDCRRNREKFGSWKIKSEKNLTDLQSELERQMKYLRLEISALRCVERIEWE
jgi:hypothetical protein